jgi:hypothetical protein
MLISEAARRFDAPHLVWNPSLDPVSLNSNWGASKRPARNPANSGHAAVSAPSSLIALAADPRSRAARNHHAVRILRR